MTKPIRVTEARQSVKEGSVGGNDFTVSKWMVRGRIPLATAERLLDDLKREGASASLHAVSFAGRDVEDAPARLSGRAFAMAVDIGNAQAVAEFVGHGRLHGYYPRKTRARR